MIRFKIKSSKVLSILTMIWTLCEGKVEIIRAKYGSGSYIITCKENSTVENIDGSQINSTITELSINECPPPQTMGVNGSTAPGTYLSTFEALGLNAGALNTLYIVNVPHSSPLTIEHLRGIESATLVAVSEGSSSFTIKHNPASRDTGNGAVDFNKGGTVSLSCNSGTRLEDQPSPWFNQTLHPDTLSIGRCPIPKETYGQYINNLNIDTTFNTLQIFNLPHNESLNEVHFADLNVKKIEIHLKENADEGKVIYELKVNDTVNLTNGEYLQITCLSSGGAYIPIESFQSVLFNRTIRVKNVIAHKCKLPDTSYAQALKEIGIDPTSISDFEVRLLAEDKPFRPEHFEKLAIRSLKLSSLLPKPYYKNVLQSSKDVFEQLRNLSSLSVEAMTLPPLPDTSELREVSLSNGVSTGAFGGCSELRNLSLKLWSVSQENGWLANCTNLNRVELKKVSEYMIKRILSSTKSFTALSIEDCNLLTISNDIFGDGNTLKELKLVNNKLYSLEFSNFNRNNEIEVLDLSHNKLNQWKYLKNSLYYLPKLRELSLAHNNMKLFCDSDPRITYDYRIDQGSPLKVHTRTMRSFSLHATQISKLCFEDWHMLESLNISSSRITELKLNRLPSPTNHTVVIDLRDNPLQEFPRTLKDYELIKLKFTQAKNVTVKLNLDLECDCQHAWFARALKDTPRLTVEGARCNTGEELRNVQVQQLECNKTVCAAGCVCRVPWSDAGTDVECSGTELTEVPRVRNLRSLTAPGNFIENLRGIDLPDSLLLLDIRNNHLSRMDAETAATLFSVPTRRIKLGANPIACDCENQPFLFELQSHRSQVEDYDNVTCVGSDLPLRDVVVDALCQAEQERVVLVAASVGGAFLVLTLILLVLYRRYRQTIKMFLYSRGCCLRWLHEEEIDSDRPYDAFLSFSHKDESFIAEHLLPGLEEIPEPYRVCVHLRDWIAGELIPTQIAKSIQLSRRIIIVLSRNFIESVWGMLEFRMAYTNSLREGRQRVILVVLDDVVHDEGLAPDLKDYVASTTYVRWGDPWFWQKLRYALPHRRATGTASASPHSGGDVPVISPRLELQHWPITMS